MSNGGQCDRDKCRREARMKAEQAALVQKLKRDAYNGANATYVNHEEKDLNANLPSTKFGQ